MTPLLDSHNPKLLAEVLKNVSDGVYFVDRQRRITYWNAAAERITGYRSKDLIGSHCYDNILRHVDDRGTCLCTGLCPLVKAMRDKKATQTRAFLHHKHGHRLPVCIRTFPLHDRDGKITGAIEIFGGVSPREELEEQIHKLEKLALVDTLTKVTNRHFLEMTLRAKIDQTRRYGWKVGVIFLDIDHFKAINDTWGHNAGDKVLRMVARNLLGNSRSFDTIGRWGGEEFIVVGDSADLDQMRALAERYRMLVEASSVAVAKGRIYLTLSAGVTMARQTDTVRSLVGRADRLMYESKRAGRNRVTAGV